VGPRLLHNFRCSHPWLLDFGEIVHNSFLAAAALTHAGAGLWGSLHKSFAVAAAGLWGDSDGHEHKGIESESNHIRPFTTKGKGREWERVGGQESNIRRSMGEDDQTVGESMSGATE
jgi:hypothetical protein